MRFRHKLEDRKSARPHNSRQATRARRRGHRMKRREFISLLGGAATAWPLAAHAQQPKMATVGILITGNTSPEAFLQGFPAALPAAGLIQGHNYPIEIRPA